MNTIKFEIPDCPEVRQAVANWLVKEAASVDVYAEPADAITATTPVAEVVQEYQDGPTETEKMEFKNPYPVEPIAPPAAETVEPIVAPAPPVADVDSSGRPWDERIDSGARSFVAAGTWKKKRGVDPAYYDQVIAECSGVGKPQGASAPENIPEAPATVPAIPTPPSPVQGNATPPAPAAPAATSSPSSDKRETVTFQELVTKIIDTGADEVKVLECVLYAKYPDLMALGASGDEKAMAITYNAL